MAPRRALKLMALSKYVCCQTRKAEKSFKMKFISNTPHGKSNTVLTENDMTKPSLWTNKMPC